MFFPYDFNKIIFLLFLQLVRKDMEVNEYENLSNIRLGHKVKEQRFHCCSVFHNHSKLLRFNHAV